MMSPTDFLGRNILSPKWGYWYVLDEPEGPPPTRPSHKESRLKTPEDAAEYARAKELLEELENNKFIYWDYDGPTLESEMVTVYDETLEEYNTRYKAWRYPSTAHLVIPEGALNYNGL